MTKELTIERVKGFESLDLEINEDGSLSIYEHHDRGCFGVCLSSQELEQLKKFINN